MENQQAELPPATDKQNEPNDPYHITYIIHFLLGAGYLVPWNSFITAVDYFQDLYPANHVSKVFSVAYMAAASTVLFILTWWSSSGKTKLPRFKVRMNLGYGLFIFALMVAPVTDWIDRRNEVRLGSNVAFLVLVSMVAVTGFAEGLTSGSLIGATGKLPGRYMQAVVAGNASAGPLPDLPLFLPSQTEDQKKRDIQKKTAKNIRPIEERAILFLEAQDRVRKGALVK